MNSRQDSLNRDLILGLDSFSNVSNASAKGNLICISGVCILVLLSFLSISDAWAAPPEEPGSAAGEGIAVCERNPHYLCFRGRPTLLIASGEHYGSIMNLDFDYRPYLDTVKKDGQNLVRIWSGAYREHPGSFGIPRNTMNPASGRFLAPWARSSTPGYTMGGNKFDLTKWDDAYFARLRDFVAEASQRDIAVELTFFCTFFYLSEHEAWDASPMNARNNINGIGDVPANRAYDLRNERLTAVQNDLVRKLITELRGANNVYFEIINEPYHWIGPVPRDWQAEMIRTASDALHSTGSHALLAQNVAQGRGHVAHLDPAISIINFHYAPPFAVGDNSDWKRPVSFDEDGFGIPGDWSYRQHAWEFLMAGGAVYDNLDYTFTVGHEDGTDMQEQAPGWGGPSYRRQLRILKEFFDGFDLLALTPLRPLIVGGVANADEVTQESTARGLGLANEGREYALYITGKHIVDRLLLDVAAGTYRLTWLDPATGEKRDAGTVTRGEGLLEVPIPEYKEDIALAMHAVHASPSAQ